MDKKKKKKKVWARKLKKEENRKTRKQIKKKQKQTTKRRKKRRRGSEKTRVSSKLQPEQRTPFNKPPHIQTEPESHHGNETGNPENEGRRGSRDLRQNLLNYNPALHLFVCTI